MIMLLENTIKLHASLKFRERNVFKALCRVVSRKKTWPFPFTYMQFPKNYGFTLQITKSNQNKSWNPMAWSFKSLW